MALMFSFSSQSLTFALCGNGFNVTWPSLSVISENIRIYRLFEWKHILFEALTSRIIEIIRQHLDEWLRRTSLKAIMATFFYVYLEIVKSVKQLRWQSALWVLFRPRWLEYLVVDTIYNIKLQVFKFIT